ncbi:MAG: hypothetical protein A2359_04975 [Candidatus Moranbacteria bacterium RIFOXYB1_FULL_43_19]|nr:MAG: hypothetical protein A2359_04975 [Candidatus Moranbacteria bacterium RIFOXYB1_FULL_43_19]OGI28045.1 MAG: hypothetical protein A2184_01810 [Candidatus Moranbacteria bacterium RIFOXYA1_FULL_44_7]OGI33606.1 MAG: hypothetical protein A2420_00605 [Candidatus Moranbacteria bacterium RIFOXYC1_FULL_44_13]OGI37151.1 MAG: hypothetical protein A2612_00140 [Candidatus Moranbacteria bacterium RIFOXYD1_FULL_44_12]
MRFDFPDRCGRVLADALKYSEDAAFNRFPSSRKEKFEKDLKETNFPLRHLCSQFDGCPVEVRIICEERIQQFRSCP